MGLRRELPGLAIFVLLTCGASHLVLAEPSHLPATEKTLSEPGLAVPNGRGHCKFPALTCEDTVPDSTNRMRPSEPARLDMEASLRTPIYSLIEPVLPIRDFGYLEHKREPGWKDLPGDLIQDQFFLWTKPFHPSAKDLPWTAAVVGSAAGLVAFVDQPVGRGLSDSAPGGGYAFGARVGRYSGTYAAFGVPLGFHLAGHLTGNRRARSTGLLGFRAVANVQIIVQALKTATQRPRPTLEGGAVQNHQADGEFFTGGNSFPSGHAAGAWAARRPSSPANTATGAGLLPPLTDWRGSSR